MLVKALDFDKLEEFKTYCLIHRDEVDESFIGDMELEKFSISEDNPTFILLNDQDVIVGVLSVMTSDYYRNGKRARVRIFHSVLKEFSTYKLLFERIQYLKADFTDIFMYAFEKDQTTIDIYKKLSCTVERYIYVLECDLDDINIAEKPNYYLKDLIFEKDESDWCEVYNEAFAGQKISDLTVQMVKDLKSSDGFIEGGMKLLYDVNKPIAFIMITEESEETSYIGPLGVKPSYQKQGIGRYMIKIAKKFSKDKGYKKAILVVNSHNESALSLYLSEGFKKTESVICFNYKL